MKTIRFLEGFILGGLIGAAMALLVSPASGEELRGKIQAEADRIRAEVNKAASDRRAELEQQLSTLRAPRTSKPAAD
jgi:gas vesicle protein